MLTLCGMLVCSGGSHVDGLFYSQFSFLHIVPNATRQDKNIIFKIVSVRAVSFSGKELVSMPEPRQMEPRRMWVLTVATLQVLASVRTSCWAGAKALWLNCLCQPWIELME